MSLIFQNFVIAIIFNLDIIFTNLIAADAQGLTSASSNIKCQIPDHKPHTHYKLLGLNDVNHLKPGEDVQAPNAVEIVCDKGYQKIPSPIGFSLCYYNGTWSSPLSSCLRSCPSLKSTTSTTVICNYKNRRLDDCNSPVQGTVVERTCNPLYYEHNVKVSPKHYCRNGKWTPYINSCEPRCGKKRAEGVTNIIGGQQAVIGTYPWQVGVYDDQKNFKCGGAIIKRHIVLSAAHCFTTRSGIRLPVEKYFLAAGKHYSKYEDDRDFDAQFTKVSKIYIPDDYRPDHTYQTNDIAVLILTVPFTITVNVHLVCIELNGETIILDPSSNNNKGIVTGWGKVAEDKDISNVLKELEIPIISFENCYERVPSEFREFLTSDKICGGYLNKSTGVCSGDSGGGLVFKDHADQYYIKGIVSVSPRSDQFQCDSNQYSLFTSVKAHINYILEILNKNQETDSIEISEELEVYDEFSDGNHTPDQLLLEPTCSQNEQWKPGPAKCARNCPSLNSSSSTNVKCQYFGNPVANCKNAMEGTKALFSCNRYYEESSILTNNILSCAEGKWNSSIPQCYPICGDSNDMYSWHVGIYNKSKEFVCGGSIISPKIILSAAQCFTDRNGKMKPPEIYLVAAGKHFREYSDHRDVDAQYSMILQIHIPPNYRGRIGHNSADIAVLILPNPLVLSKAVQPICLDQKETSRNLNTSIYHDVTGEITGWGYIKKTKKFSNALEELGVTYIPGGKCSKELLQKGFNKYITYDKMCGKHNKNDVCGGDNGGGLIFYNNFDDRYYIKGILSVASESSEHQCDLEDFSFYTSVGIYRDFLNNIIAKTP